MAIVVIDPGHGGHVDMGRSTWGGVGRVEKHVTLALARRVARQLGAGVRLTRVGDENLPLAERADIARQLGADAFVSIHASEGRGVQAFVHPRGSGSSRALAAAIAGEARTAEMAVLTPERHAAHTAACLVEIDLLSPDPHRLDDASRAIATGIRRWMGPAALGSPAFRGAHAGALVAAPVDSPPIVPDPPTDEQRGDAEAFRTIEAALPEMAFPDARQVLLAARDVLRGLASERKVEVAGAIVTLRARIAAELLPQIEETVQRAYPAYLDDIRFQVDGGGGVPPRQPPQLPPDLEASTDQPALAHIALQRLSAAQARLALTDLEGLSRDGGTITIDGEDFTVTGAQAKGLAADVRLHVIEALMDDVHRRRSKLAVAMNEAPDEASRRAAMLKLSAIVKPALDELQRFTVTGAGAARKAAELRHPDPDAVDSVLAALQLEAVFSAETDLEPARTALAHRRSADSMDMGLGFDWCGFFVAHHLLQVRLDTRMRGAHFHTNDLDRFYKYRDRPPGLDTRAPRWVYADGEWQGVEDYHRARGSMRRWVSSAEIADGGPLDIRPGDVLLLDRADTIGNGLTHKNQADHIQMVHSYNPDTGHVFIIDGNSNNLVARRPGDAAPAGETSEQQSERLETEVALGTPMKQQRWDFHVGAGMHNLRFQLNPYELEDFNYRPAADNEWRKSLDPPPGDPRAPREHRVYGIGRLSLVDMETHTYSADVAKPTRKP